MTGVEGLSFPEEGQEVPEQEDASELETRAMLSIVA